MWVLSLRIGRRLILCRTGDWDMLQGGCACGSVRFEIDAVRSLTHCHCTICRKLTGASFATYAHVEKSKFRWLGGQKTIRRY
jgi:hypothetical protein